ncbi:MAG: protein TolQ [Piscirickettsiaceae bacterium CG_4_9_14_3_um_filter_43_564]|nr:protein TolQ [Thiomicrospira sp.]OIP96830.1 MAG: protein TolQ [Thiomicrospira sp. CG2_30_44_34]PIQ04726.1 MAG: protein TolQ [Piscirickettsiaceae bacterium CG18_big_fil_WC_8_21_14_2_50_44_103]PIU39336.1 MAG: protein TolQ [Piscirickettsiaceae bacterium CG07_land_8_20_14_0_80_44_28]PIW56720.1 MAG: protein TolQ [Piscirickettsiaceae bacterium CG12_big_fil_rev_8_21_14_0_65_44_934]PIW77827.1 MAG: protein TolQ [Piscirickettsiaceae bacterium CG_4_8_14_3_um_filter_44_38]PIX79547.1 MAG: protein TolQ 
MNEHSLLELVLNASQVVQGVMLILLLMSILAWAVFFAKSFQLRKARIEAQEFDTLFWNTPELTQLYQIVTAETDKQYGNAVIFEAGFKEFVRLKQQGVVNSNDLINGAQRAMKVAFSKQVERLENRTPFLATVGSSAPYIGLFGTVWGVMHAFSSLGDIQNATLAAVAPGISEALIATAMGLFAAIPAVIAYNRLAVKTDKVITQYENFAEGFLTIIQRQAHTHESHVD